ncbi:GspE/PulE family protein [Marinobacter subterrani]|uniref:GspE/PulE family protein n=1 Tax=Marinobacter subterrani TaxID=1658765 RepID=UPI002357A3B2|nr:ATPase, T2SS/T4P/T4SS family [Marinobacter subterrani]
MSAIGKTHRSLGQILKEQGWLTEELLQKALAKQSALSNKGGKKVSIGKILLSNGIITEAQLEKGLKLQKASRAVEFKTRSELEEIYGKLRYQYGDYETKDPFVPTEHGRDLVVVETLEGNPLLLVTREFQQTMFNIVFAVRKKLQKAYIDESGKSISITTVHVTPDVLSLYRQDTETQAADDFKGQTKHESEFESLIKQAYEEKAVDLHFFRGTDICRVRLRVWGSLRDYEDWDPEKADDIISVGFSTFGKGGKYSHWKKNQRQRIRMKIRYSQHITLDCRYEHSPGDDGAYHACIRILANDKRDITKQIDLRELGFTKAQALSIEAAASSASGMLILAGPTGSGKSTTLAGVVKYINRNDDTNVLTVESPIERELPAFQTSVSDDDDADPKEFAKAIKSTLRRDPDVLMVGEIRDEMSASAAATGVQTGHTLLTTVHAQSAIEIVERLSSPAMALPPETIGSPSFLAALIFQVLLPTLDPNSKLGLTMANIDEHLAPEERERLLSVVPDIDKHEICIRGSNRENPEGISGMTICAEVVIPDETMRRHFRKMELTEAMNHWIEKGKSDAAKGAPLADRITGLRASSHAFGKMLQGLIDPRDFEAKFGHMNLIEVSSS